tara:strand:- start:3585 stop:3965 length:381 start_codon:yes stop_codon:yes gene_type:complete
MLKYTIIFTLFYLQVFLYSFSAQGSHRPNPIPEDLIAYKSFCVDEDAILRVGKGLQESKQKADLIFLTLSGGERCFTHPKKVIGLVVEEIYRFKNYLKIETIVYKIQTNPIEFGFILYLSAPKLGV